MLHRTLAFFVLCPSLALAQSTTVVPRAYAAAEASAASNRPFGVSLPTRMQFLYDASTVAIAGATVTHVALRGDGGDVAAAKAGIDVEIRMSATSTSVWAAQTTFAQNHGAPQATPFARKLVNLPALAATPIPAPFTARFPLDTPFRYAPAMGNLVIEWLVFAQPASLYSHDATNLSLATYTPIGTACGVHQTVVGGTFSLAFGLTFSLTGAPPSGSGVHVLGAITWPGVPLPLGGCPLHVAPRALVPVTVSAAGTATSGYPLQWWFKGATVHGQFVVADSSLMRIVASQAHTVVMGGVDPVTCVFHPASATSPSGFVQLGLANVVELGY